MVTNLSVGKICGSVFLFFVLTGSAFSQDPATGLSVYQSKCQRCHGADARGNREISVALDIEFRYLGSAETQALTDLEIRQLIVRGKGKMWITASQPNQRIDYQMLFADFPRMESSIILQPDGDSTTVVWQSSGRLPSGPFFGYFAWLFGRQMEYQYQSSLENLKQIVEKQP